DIDVGYPGPHSVFLPCGQDYKFIDYAHLWRRLYHLFHQVTPSDQNFKGEALEIFTRGERSVLPSGELKAVDSTSRQIDAAFGIGELLVIAECRAVARSIAFDRGDPVALEKRRQVIETALNDIDEK